MRKLDTLSSRPNGRQACDGGPIDHQGWLVALIEGADDAILSRNLDGTIQSWNGGATRLFGYSANEVIGRPITLIVPEDRLEEEASTFAQIQRGRPVERFETKRRRKDGSLVDISLTVSVIRSVDGTVVGASKIARDITQTVLAREQQRLLMREMRHRVKNLFALAAAIVSISARSPRSDVDVIADIRARLTSLARAHDMAMAERPLDGEARQALTLRALIGRILDPYTVGDGKVVIAGDDCEVGAKAVPYLSLLLHELATNAAKFGCLSVGSGRLAVSVTTVGDRVRLVWRETGGPPPQLGGATGFGGQLEQSVTRALATTIERQWRHTGLVATIAIPRSALVV